MLDLLLSERDSIPGQVLKCLVRTKPVSNSENVCNPKLHYITIVLKLGVYLAQELREAQSKIMLPLQPLTIKELFINEPFIVHMQVKAVNIFVGQHKTQYKTSSLNCTSTRTSDFKQIKHINLFSQGDMNGY